MKQKLIIALLLNLGLFLFCCYIFITKGVATNEFILWKFLASLLGVIVFGIFIFYIQQQLRKLK